MCYEVPTARHSGGVLNVTKVMIISHLITISYIDLFSCKYETSLFKTDGGFKAVSELGEDSSVIIQSLLCMSGQYCSELSWYETTINLLVLGGINVKGFLSFVISIASWF